MFSTKSFIPIFLSLLLCLVMGSSVYLLGIIACLVELLFIVMVISGCKNYKKNVGNISYIKRVISVYDAAESCFAVMAVAAVCSFIWLIPDALFNFIGIFINPNFWYILFTVGNIYFFIKAGDHIQEMKREKAFLENPPISKMDEYFSEIISDKDISTNDTDIGIADVSEKLLKEIPQDELVPHAAELKALVKKQSACTKTAEETPEAWICPMCGSENPDDFAECVFCGAAKNADKE